MESKTNTKSYVQTNFCIMSWINKSSYNTWLFQTPFWFSFFSALVHSQLYSYSNMSYEGSQKIKLMNTKTQLLSHTPVVSNGNWQDWPTSIPGYFQERSGNYFEETLFKWRKLLHQRYFCHLYVERLRVSSSIAISSICRAVDSYQRKQSTVARSWLSSPH